MKDSEFTRGNVPMTKEEIRSIVLDKLELAADDTLMDIGAGTGSVAIEAALRLKNGTVIAVEHNPEAVALIAENARKHGVHNLRIAHGKAPGAMGDIANTRKFFIGGSGGNLAEILGLIDTSSAAGSIVVVTAIVIDTMIDAYNFFRDKPGYQTELVQVSVNKIEQGKSPAMLLAANPVFIITARKI